MTFMPSARLLSRKADQLPGGPPLRERFRLSRQKAWLITKPCLMFAGACRATARSSDRSNGRPRGWSANRRSDWRVSLDFPASVIVSIRRIAASRFGCRAARPDSRRLDVLLPGDGDLAPFLARVVGAAVQDQAQRPPRDRRKAAGTANWSPRTSSGLDGVELLERALDVERIKLVRRDAVGQQRDLERGHRLIAAASACREIS
jgi:hypothetical protein